MNSAAQNLLPLALYQVPEFVRAALAEEAVPTVEFATGAGESRFVIVGGTRAPAGLVAGQELIFLESLYRESSSTTRAKRACGAALCGWRIGELDVHEQVQPASRAVARRELLTGLRNAVQARGGLWLTIDPVPHPFRSAFSLRLDHDEYCQADFAAVLDAVRGCEHGVSHYVNAAGHASAGAALEKLRGQHVGSHGWWHHTYVEAAANHTNLRRGIDFLDGLRLSPTGCVAPHGKYTAGWRQAVGELGITHSSEFSLARDDWPFFPAGSRALQIPIHPVCLGICLQAARRQGVEASRATKAFAGHLEHVLQERVTAWEPVIVYGHPDGRLGRCPWLVRNILRQVAATSRLWMTNFARLEDWWRARASVLLTARAVERGFAVESGNLPSGFTCSLRVWSKDHVARVPIVRRRMTIHPSLLTFEASPAPTDFEPIELRDRQPLRSRLCRALDWERVTPIAELTGNSPRVRLKRTLRTLFASPAGQQLSQRA